MALLRSIWFLSTIVAYYSIPYTYTKKAFVTPSEDVACPSQPCLTLNDYARETDQYFVDNTTFVLLTGIHQLDIQLHLENLSNITLFVIDEVQHDNIKIFLSPSVNIMWTDCNSIEISGLVFVVSGESEGEIIIPVLVFRKTSSSLSELTLFGNCKLRTIFQIVSSEMKISSVMVMRATSFRDSAIFGYNSTLNFFGQNIFINNTATRDGGAIALYDCTSHFYGNVSFVNNKAIRGGALLLSDGVHDISGNISFVNNAAIQGGGMAIVRSINTISGNISFVRNTAILESDDVYYKPSGGGAIYGISSIIYYIGRNIVFELNLALFGAAIYVVDTRVNMTGTLFFVEFSPTRWSNGLQW